jgi:hypothetical protein
MDEKEALAQLQHLLETPEELDPELAAYLTETEHGFWALRHPLVYHVPYHQTMNALANAALKGKREEVAEARQSKDWRRYLFLHERPYRIDAFTHICWQMGSKTYWELLGSIWTDTENLWQNQNEWRQCLTAERSCRNHLMKPEERATLKLYPSQFPVYRGYSAPGTLLGLSWTTNPVIAKFFARRLAEPDSLRFVARGTVRRRDVLAYFNGRDEGEMVVLPENVFDIEIEEVPRGKA